MRSIICILSCDIYTEEGLRQAADFEIVINKQQSQVSRKPLSRSQRSVKFVKYLNSLIDLS